jgi:hypothetical protein
MGHHDAAKSMLEHFLYRANSLKRANPALAVVTYEAAIKVDPKIQTVVGENGRKTIAMVAEATNFDADAFMKKYGVKDTDPERTELYHVWLLAEEASRGGRFGRPDPELVFNLVVRGGEVPAEYWGAVEWAYKNWKAGKVEEFMIDNFITSGMGMGFCAHRQSLKNDEKRKERIGKLKAGLNPETAKLLGAAYAAAVAFIEAKARTEEGHGGSGRVAWIISSEQTQKDAYLDMIYKAIKGWAPPAGTTLAIADKRLNAVYRSAMRKLKADKSDFRQVGPDDLRAVQRLWIPHRDVTARVLAAVTTTGEDKWKRYFAAERTQRLAEVVKEGHSSSPSLEQ